jgi:hypothetical protein
MPTIAEAVVVELAHSGQLEQVQLWVNTNLKPWVDFWTAVHPKICEGMFLMAGASAKRTEQKFPSKGYAPYFEAHGFAPLLARGLGSLTISLGVREAHEARRVFAVVEAVRFLQQADRQKRAIVSRARLVLAASQETSIVGELFRHAGLHEGEFLNLLQAALDGGAIDRERIRAIAAAIAPSAHAGQGRKIRAASAARELFLKTNEPLGLPAGYTWNAYKRDFVDQETQATRLEFDKPKFSPRSTHRRLMRRGSVNPSKSRSRTR